MTAIERALRAAALAFAAALGEGDEPEKPATEKKKSTPKPPAEEKKPEPPKEEPKKEEPKPDTALLDKARKAAQEFAGIQGRDALRAILDKYTKQTLADVPADRLPELLKELGG